MAYFDQFSREGFQQLSKPFGGGGQTSMATPYLNTSSGGGGSDTTGQAPTMRPRGGGGGSARGGGSNGWNWGNWGWGQGQGRGGGGMSPPYVPPIVGQPGGQQGQPGMPPGGLPADVNTRRWAAGLPPLPGYPPAPGQSQPGPDSTIGLPPLGTQPGGPGGMSPPYVPRITGPDSTIGLPPLGGPEGGIPPPPQYTTGTMYPPGQSPLELWEAQWGDAWRRQQQRGPFVPRAGAGGQSPPYVPTIQPGGGPGQLPPVGTHPSHPGDAQFSNPYAVPVPPGPAKPTVYPWQPPGTTPPIGRGDGGMTPPYVPPITGGGAGGMTPPYVPPLQRSMAGYY